MVARVGVGLEAVVTVGHKVFSTLDRPAETPGAQLPRSSGRAWLRLLQAGRANPQLEALNMWHRLSSLFSA